MLLFEYLAITVAYLAGFVIVNISLVAWIGMMVNKYERPRALLLLGAGLLAAYLLWFA